jgi:hypothetical protein
LDGLSRQRSGRWGTEIPPVSFSLLLIVIPLVTALGFVFGFVGAGLCKIFKQARSVDA